MKRGRIRPESREEPLQEDDYAQLRGMKRVTRD